MHRSRFWKAVGGLLISLSLGACLTPSPLSAESHVEIEGRILGLSGQAVLDQSISLSLPFVQQRQTDTDAAGDYHFQVKASETQVAGLAVDLSLTAEQANGMALAQRFKALKTQIYLPDMRFWNELTAPAAGAVMTQARQNLSWQAPSATHQSIKQYHILIENQAGEAVWQSLSGGRGLNYDLPTAVLEPNQTYRWQIEAEGDNYSAFSEKRSLKTGALPLRSLVLQAAEIKGQVYRSWFDGDYRFALKERLDLEPQTAVEIELKWANSERVQGLHWAATGFAVAVELYDPATDTLLASREVSEDSLFEWPVVTTQGLRLRLRAVKGGFIDIREIRVLAPGSGSGQASSG